MKGLGRTVNGALKARSYAAQASAQTQTKEASRSSPISKNDVQVTKLTNGVTVATLENHSPISRLFFCYDAGAKYETGYNKGVTHAIRNAAGNISTKTISAFALTKRTQQMGASVSCTVNREQIIYSIECLRSFVDDGFFFLGEMATEPVFKPWEIAALIPRHQADVANLAQRPEVQVLELLHKAAFRSGGLGNSLFMPKDRIGSHTTEMMEDYCHRYMTPINLSVVGVGMDHERILHDFKKLDVSVDTAPAKPVPSFFQGGEIRVETPSDQVHVALVSEGLKLNDQDLAVAGVLQRLMGVGPVIKHSTPNNSRITQAIRQVTQKPAAGSCVNMNYGEAGMFGIQAVADAAEVAPVLQAIIRSFSDIMKGNVSEQDINAAKAQLKCGILLEYENDESMIEDIDVRAMATGEASNAADVAASIDQITGDDLAKMARKILDSKSAMAAIGDLTCTPHLDELV